MAQKIKVKNRLPQTNTTITSQGVGISNDQVKTVTVNKEVTEYLNTGRLVKAEKADEDKAAAAEKAAKEAADKVAAEKAAKTSEKK